MYKSFCGRKPLENGTVVEVKLYKDNIMYVQAGTICGIVSEQPVVGFIYIVQFDEPISEEYPYTAFAFPETQIK